MGAFVIGGLLFVATIGGSALILFGSMMSDSVSASEAAGRSALGVFIGGTVVSALVVASHWMPHVGW